MENGKTKLINILRNPVDGRMFFLPQLCVQSRDHKTSELLICTNFLFTEPHVEAIRFFTIYNHFLKVNWLPKQRVDIFSK